MYRQTYKLIIFALFAWTLILISQATYAEQLQTKGSQVQSSESPSAVDQTNEDLTESTAELATHVHEIGQNPYISLLVLIPLYFVIFVLLVYVIRHYAFTFNRLFGHQRNLYAEIIDANWPSVTIIVPAHNEEIVIADSLSAILSTDYPEELMQIIVINDRSTDKTANIIDDFVKRHPARITAFHRKTGIPGKSAALKDSFELVKGDVIIVFDADNIPGRYLIKQLVSPFFDPEVGSVMGRAVPGNTDSNLLTRLLDMERSAGYQVNQQARANLLAVPQYGGTAGGIRTRALLEVGGWRAGALAEDTEITFRLLCQGWKTIYQNNCECLEQVPEAWPVRISQIRRWGKGHNQVMFHYLFKVIFNRDINFFARLDGMLLLCLFVVSPLLLFGWFLFLLAFYLNLISWPGSILALLAIISCGGAGNFSLFYEVSTAVHLDNLRGVQGNRIRLLPISYFNFFVSLFALSGAFFEQITTDQVKKELVWDKTERYHRKKGKK